MNINETKAAISHIFAIGRTPHLIGKHGLGKSSVVAQWCKENGYEMVDVRLGQMADAGDIIGLPEFHTDENGKYTKYVLPDFFPRKPNTVIFLDEINRASKDLLQAVFELIYDKRLKGVALPANCHIIAASNPATDDYAVLDFSDSAFQDRFVHLEFSPSEKEFVDYMKDVKGFTSSGFLAFLQEDPRMMDDANLQGIDMSFVKPSRRSWDAALQIEAMYDAGKMDKNMFMSIVSGIVGATATIAAIAFKDTHVGSINPVEILDGYHTGDIRSRVLNAVKKNRTDIIGDMIQNMDKEFKAREKTGLTNQAGLNIISLAKDLNPEQTYALLTTIAQNHSCCNNVEGMDGGGNPDEAGLLNNDELISVLTKTKEARERAGKAIEKAKKKTKKSEEIPF